MTKHRLLIAEDHGILRDGLRSLLENTDDMEVIGEATNGREAVQLAVKLHPDLVLMDLSMPDTNGTEAIPAIKNRARDIKVIALTVHKAEEYVRASLNAGADGYVLKEESQAELLNAIRNVLAGQTYLSPGVCKHVVTGFLAKDEPRKEEGVGGHTWDSLTVREREILKLIAEGKRNKDIAAYLSISVKTVEKHRSNLMRKIGAHNISQVTAFAIENNLITRG